MLRRLILLLVLSISGQLVAQAKPESPVQNPWALQKTYAYFDLGLGPVKDEFGSGVSGGLCLGWQNKLLLNAYFTTFSDHDQDFLGHVPARYHFSGVGFQLGSTVTQGCTSLIPSLGICRGRISIGEELTSYSNEWFSDAYWAERRTEMITYIPISLTGQVSMLPNLGARIKLEHLRHKHYPITTISLGISFGNI